MNMTESDLPSGSDDECNLGLSINEEVTVGLGVSLSLDGIQIGLLVLGIVVGGSLGGGLSGFGAFLLGYDTGGDASLEELGVSGLLLKNVLWDNFCPKTKHEKRDVSQLVSRRELKGRVSGFDQVDGVLDRIRCTHSFKYKRPTF